VFTGLVQHVGVVSALQTRGEQVRIVIDPCGWGHRPARGDSIAVSGCCLTVAEDLESVAGHFAFDAIPETMAKTKLGTFKVGTPVNLEHSVTASTLMDGHFVQGHVDATAAVAAVQTGDDWRIRFSPPVGLMPYFVPKGSVCIDGVSLTLAEVGPSHIAVALIPETLARTTLGTLRSGDLVNVEADILSKTVVNTLRQHLANLSPESIKVMLGHDGAGA
jgi:riboflavin synthase